MPLRSTRHTPPNQDGAPSGPINVIYAKWSGRIRATPTEPDHPVFVDSYDVTIRPHVPIAVGQTVKILALSLEAYHLPVYPPPYPPRYDVYDPQIEGRIIRIRSIESGTVKFALENRMRGTAVSMVYVAVQYIPNVTVKLDVVDKAYRWLTQAQPNTRFIPLEEAIIVDTIISSQYSSGHAAAGPIAPKRAPYPVPRNDETIWPEKEGDTEDRYQAMGTEVTLAPRDLPGRMRPTRGSRYWE